jgi:uncharacterized protein YbcI
MSAIRTEHASEGRLATAISNMVVQALRQYTGRGPTRSRTYIHDQLISVVLQGTLTRAERRLVADGKSELVLHTRKAFQGLMRADLVAGVEALTGRRVIAFLGSNSIDPDVNVESFLLAPGANTEGATSAPV